MCAGLCGLTVAPGKAVGELGRHRLAHDRAAGHAQQRDAGGVGERPVAAIDRRAVPGRHVDGVDDVLDPDRQPGEQARPAGAVGRARLRQRLLRVEPGPGLDRSALGGAVEAGAGQRLGGQRRRQRAARPPRRRKAGSSARHCRAPRVALDPQPDIEQPCIVVAAADQLDADRQPVRPLAGRQGQARHVEHGPQRVENRRAGRAEPRGAWPGAGRVRIASNPPAHSCAAARASLGAAPGGAEIVEAQLAAVGDLAVEQIGAQQRRVAVQLRRMDARRLEGAVAALDLGNVGAFGRQFALDDLGPGGAQPSPRRLRAPPCPPARRRPNAACGTARGAAAAPASRGAS